MIGPGQQHLKPQLHQPVQNSSMAHKASLRCVAHNLLLVWHLRHSYRQEFSFTLECCSPRSTRDIVIHIAIWLFSYNILEYIDIYQYTCFDGWKSRLIDVYLLAGYNVQKQGKVRLG